MNSAWIFDYLREFLLIFFCINKVVVYFKNTYFKEIHIETFTDELYIWNLFQNNTWQQSGECEVWINQDCYELIKTEMDEEYAGVCSSIHSTFLTIKIFHIKKVKNLNLETHL